MPRCVRLGFVGLHPESGLLDLSDARLTFDPAMLFVTAWHYHFLLAGAWAADGGADAAPTAASAAAAAKAAAAAAAGQNAAHRAGAERGASLCRVAQLRCARARCFFSFPALQCHSRRRSALLFPALDLLSLYKNCVFDFKSSCGVRWRQQGGDATARGCSAGLYEQRKRSTCWAGE